LLTLRPLAFALSSPVGGWFTGRVGTRLATVVGCLVLAGGLTGLALGASFGSLLVVVVGGFVVQGIGYGLLRPAIPTALANAVDQVDLGVAAASERLMGGLGFAAGVALLVSVYGGEADAAHFAGAFALGAALAVVAAGAALFMSKAHPAVEDDLVAELAREQTGGLVAEGEPVGRSTSGAGWRPWRQRSWSGSSGR
jgi:MFS family permease